MGTSWGYITIYSLYIYIHTHVYIYICIYICIYPYPVALFCMMETGNHSSFNPIGISPLTAPHIHMSKIIVYAYDVKRPSFIGRKMEFIKIY